MTSRTGCESCRSLFHSRSPPYERLRLFNNHFGGNVGVVFQRDPSVVWQWVSSMSVYNRVWTMFFTPWMESLCTCIFQESLLNQEWNVHVYRESLSDGIKKLEEDKENASQTDGNSTKKGADDLSEIDWDADMPMSDWSLLGDNWCVSSDSWLILKGSKCILWQVHCSNYSWFAVSFNICLISIVNCIWIHVSPKELMVQHRIIQSYSIDWKTCTAKNSILKQRL